MGTRLKLYTWVKLKSTTLALLSAIRSLKNIFKSNQSKKPLGSIPARL